MHTLHAPSQHLLTTSQRAHLLSNTPKACVKANVTITTSNSCKNVNPDLPPSTPPSPNLFACFFISSCFFSLNTSIYNCSLSLNLSAPLLYNDQSIACCYVAVPTAPPAGLTYTCKIASPYPLVACLNKSLLITGSLPISGVTGTDMT